MTASVRVHRLWSRALLWGVAMIPLVACGAACERTPPTPIDVSSQLAAADARVADALAEADVSAIADALIGLAEPQLTERAALLGQGSGQIARSVTDAVANPPLLPRPRRVMIVGSSSMEHGIGQSIEAYLNEYGPVHVRNEGLRSTGLSRPDYYDWLARAREFADEYWPDLVVAQFGGNDCQGTVDPEGNLVARWSTPEWEVEYGRRVSEFVRDMRSRGAFVVLIGMPTMREERFRQRIRVLNDVVERTAIIERVPFIDVEALTSDEDGEYIETGVVDGEERGLRSPDGVHLSWPGARLVARRTVDALLEHMDLENPRPPSPDDDRPVVLERSNAMPNWSNRDSEGSGDEVPLEDGSLLEGYPTDGSGPFDEGSAQVADLDREGSAPDGTDGQGGGPAEPAAGSGTGPESGAATPDSAVAPEPGEGTPDEAPPAPAPDEDAPAAPDEGAPNDDDAAPDEGPAPTESLRDAPNPPD